MKKHIKKAQSRIVDQKTPKKGSNINVVSLSTYTSPKIVEQKNRDWVLYGSDNNYFQFLIDRYNGSPTNNAVINGVSQMIYGKGLDATDSNRKPDQYAQAISLFKKDSVRKLAYDLKLMGQCAIQVIYSKDRKTIAQIEHLPIETLRSEKCDDDGNVLAYYYFPDWANIKPSDAPQRIPSFGNSKESIEILYIKPYRAGYYYYSPVDYQGGLQYAELEEEISNYHLNNILNGLAPSMLINFNQGVPNDEERTLIESRIQQKFSGSSNAGKFILSFNDSKETAAEITPVQLSDAHNQYQFLSDESTKKIMVAHRVVSPMLLGIKDSSGLGNNADELKTATLLMDNTVIRPFQNLLIESFDQILAFNGISLNLYFKTLQPLEFTDLENVMDDETMEEETGVKLSAEMNDEIANHFLDELGGELIDDDEWELVDAREFDEKNESIDNWANRLIEPLKSQLQKLADFIKSKPNGFSYLDKSFYKVRYSYSEKYSSGKMRKFCDSMMSRTSNGVVYRLEDIDKASRDGVNQSFGHKGQAYDLFKFKGGVNCGHFWSENLYRLKDKTKKGSEKISQYDETDSIPNTYKPTPNGNAESKIAPIDMPNNGHHPNYKG
jgi:hypothetical protein